MSMNRRTVSIKDLKEPGKEKKRKKDYLVSHEAEHLAQQICVWDQELFRRLRASEFLAAKWTKDDRKRLAPNIHVIIQHFNYLTRWVATEVLTQADKSARTKMAKQFVHVAEHLFKVHEYNAALAVASGLGDLNVTRLKDQIEYSKETMKSLEAIRAHLTPPFREIRSLARKQHGPCIPYIGSYLGDLAIMHEGNPTHINGLINFRKYALMASVIDELLRFQLVPYTFESDADLQDYFRTSGALSEEKLTECSHSIVPPERDNKSPASRRSFMEGPKIPLSASSGAVSAAASPASAPSTLSSATGAAAAAAIASLAPSPQAAPAELVSPRRTNSERGTTSSATAAALSQSHPLLHLPPAPVLSANHPSPGRGPLLPALVPPPQLPTGDANLANEVRALKAEVSRQREELAKAAQEAERARMEVAALQETLAQRDVKFAEVLAMAQAAVLKNREYEDRFAILEADSRILHGSVVRLQRLVPEQRLDAELTAEEQALKREEEELRALEDEHRRTYGTLRGKRV